MYIWLDPTLYPLLGIFDAVFAAGDKCACEVEGRHNDDGIVTAYSNCSLNRQIDSSHRRDDRSDCDCSYPSFAQDAIPCQSLQERVMSIWDHALRCAQDLYLAQCDTTHWLACNPVQQGIVAVLDEEALALLELFRSPRRLKDVATQWASAVEYELDQPSATPCARMVALFVSLGLIIDEDQCETSLSALAAHESDTLSAWLHVTNACNMACTYCYVSKSSEHMTADVGKRSVDAVFRSAIRANYQQVRLKYAGGEALLRLPQVLQLHDYALQLAQRHGLRLSATLLSNGAALTPRAIEQLKQRHIGVMISLDGVGADHDTQRPLVSGMGSFRLVDRAITRLLEQDLVPHISVVVSQHNLPGMPDLVSYLLERDLPFSFSYYRENNCSASLADLQFSDAQMIDGMQAAFTYIEHHLTPRRVYQSLIDKASLTTTHHHTCGVGRNYLVIDQHGGIAKCQTEMTQTITTIDADDPLQDVRMQREGAQVLDVDEKEGCRSCNWRYWCGGGCAVLNYRLTGRNDVRSPNCSIYKALFPAALRLEALRLLKYAHPL